MPPTPSHAVPPLKSPHPSALQAALAVETAPVAQAAAQRGLKGKAIGDAVNKAREQAVAEWMTLHTQSSAA